MDAKPTVTPQVVQPEPEAPVASPQVQIVEEPKAYAKLLFYPLIILLLAAAAFGAYKWEHARALKVENNLNSQISSLKQQLNSLKQSGKNTSPASSSPSSGWETYVANAASFKYPREWSVINSCQILPCLAISPLPSNVLGTSQASSRLVLWVNITKPGQNNWTVKSFDDLGAIPMNGSSTEYHLYAVKDSKGNITAVDVINVANCTALSGCSGPISRTNGTEISFVVLPGSENILGQIFTAPVDINSSDFSNIKTILESFAF